MRPLPLCLGRWAGRVSSVFHYAFRCALWSQRVSCLRVHISSLSDSLKIFRVPVTGHPPLRRRPRMGFFGVARSPVLSRPFGAL